MAVSGDVNFEELARSTDEFNGAQLKAVCVEAGMIALREGATKLSHEHFLSGIAEGMSSSNIWARVMLFMHFIQCKVRRRITLCISHRLGSVLPLYFCQYFMQDAVFFRHPGFLGESPPLNRYCSHQLIVRSQKS
jgi:SpoVK/Ycf46/Vps4 family AAA+-type ATPase